MQFGKYYIVLIELCNVTEILLQGHVPDVFSHNFDKSCYYSSDFMILWKISPGAETPKYFSDSMSGIFPY